MNRLSLPLTFITAWIVSDRILCAKQTTPQCQRQRSLTTLETVRFSSAGTGISSLLGPATQNGMLATGCSMTTDLSHTALSVMRSVLRTHPTTWSRLPILKNMATKTPGNREQAKQITSKWDSLLSLIIKCVYFVRQTHWAHSFMPVFLYQLLIWREFVMREELCQCSGTLDHLDRPFHESSVTVFTW